MCCCVSDTLRSACGLEYPKSFFLFIFVLKKKKKNCRREKMAVRPFIFLIAQSRWGEIGRNVSTQKYIARVSYVVITKFVGIPLIMVKQFLYYLPYAKYTHTHTASGVWLQQEGLYHYSNESFSLIFRLLLLLGYLLGRGKKKKKMVIFSPDRTRSCVRPNSSPWQVPYIQRLGRDDISSIHLKIW